MTKIAFASCCKIDGMYKQTYQPAWEYIEDADPDLVLLLGDNVYMSQGGNPRWNFPQLRSTYRKQFNEPHFKSLISKVPFIATWDDHDFGPNDSKGDTKDGRKYGRRDKSREIFHEFMTDSPKCKNKRPEVYCSYVIGDVKVIILDVRYYRTARRGYKATILGEEQENWLENELNHNKKFTIVGSGVGLETGGPKDRWSAYPYAYKRFKKLLEQTPKLLFLAGDIHRNKFIRHPNFYEVISSGVGRIDTETRKPINNYGLIEFGNSKVEISLRGRDRISKKIKVRTGN